MIEVFATILVVIAVILVVFASIGVVIAVFAKNKGPEFEIFFFSKIQKWYFFLTFSRFLNLHYNLRFQIVQIHCSFADICPRCCKIDLKEEAILVGHPVCMLILGFA